MKLTMLLCDHVAVAEGKLYVNGGGWNLIGPAPAPSAIAVLVEVPWDQTNRSIALHLQLLHEDGQVVTQPGPTGAAQPVEIGAQFEVGRPPGTRPGSAISFPIPINLPPFALEPGQGFYWEAELDGEKREDWRLSFRTRAIPVTPDDPAAPPAPG